MIILRERTFSESELEWIYYNSPELQKEFTFKEFVDKAKRNTRKGALAVGMAGSLASCSPGTETVKIATRDNGNQVVYYMKNGSGMTSHDTGYIGRRRGEEGKVYKITTEDLEKINNSAEIKALKKEANDPMNFGWLSAKMGEEVSTDYNNRLAEKIDSAGVMVKHKPSTAQKKAMKAAKMQKKMQKVVKKAAKKGIH